MVERTVPVRKHGRTCDSKLAYMRVGLRILRNQLGAKLVGMGPAMYGRLFQQVIKRDVQLWSGVTVEQLVIEDGRVNRADVLREGRRMVIHAKKGIIKIGRAHV